MTPDDVCAAIDRLAVGDYGSFGGRLVGGQDSRPAVGAERLLDKALRETIEDRFVRRFGTFDARAVHSIWMKWYLNAFIPPVLMADVLLQRTVAVELPEVGFIMSGDGHVDAVRIGETHVSAGESPFHRFHSLVFGHFEPLIEMWSERTGVTRRVFWSNVGNTFEAMLRRIESVSGPSQRLGEAQRLLEQADWNGEPNPLFDAVFYVDEAGEQVRRRRVCCLQYLLPDRRFCKACPVDEARAPDVAALR